jgi:hypothetical protein
MESMSRSTYRVYFDFLETAEKSAVGIFSMIFHETNSISRRLFFTRPEFEFYLAS